MKINIESQDFSIEEVKRQLNEVKVQLQREQQAKRILEEKL